MKANKPSATARLIAASTVFLSKDRNLSFLVPGEWGEPSSWFIEEYSSFGSTLLKFIPQTWFRILVRIVEKIGTSGFIVHCVLRKHCLENIVREYLQKNYSQVAVLGAGFDTLAFRLHREYSDVHFFELDFPATQQIKKNALNKNTTHGKNLSFIPVDFRQEDWLEKLLSFPGFNPQKNTVFVIEGVLMYLTQTEVEAVFSGFSQLKKMDPVVAFTFMEMAPDGTIRFQNSSSIVDLWLKIKGERFKWGIEVEKIPAFLASNGWRSLRILRADYLRETYLRSKGWDQIPLAKGESICVAEKGGTAK